MKIRDLLLKDKLSLSFEFFPPKDEQMQSDLYKTVEELRGLNPLFVSVTYGAMGTTQDKTFDLALDFKKRFSLETMAHLTSIGSTQDKIEKVLYALVKEGVENILALRGDFPPDYPDKDKRDFEYAYQLVHFIRKTLDRFSIGVAGYPENHPECKDLAKNIQYLKQKVDEGADFIITQLFFINDHFFRFCDLARKNKINIPILPGIMPLTNNKQISVFEDKCGVIIPQNLRNKVIAYGDDNKSIRSLGIDYSTKQCAELLQRGIKHLHFYTFNRSTSTRQICQNLGIKG